jgi:hypothetical protein
MMLDRVKRDRHIRVHLDSMTVEYKALLLEQLTFYWG